MEYIENIKKLIFETHPKCVHNLLKKLDNEKLIELTPFIHNGTSGQRIV